MGIDINFLGPAARKQVLDKLVDIEQAKQKKYKNVKTERTMPNGKTYVFDSRKEANRYDELSILRKAGKIRKLRLQEQFTLQESYIDENGERVRAIKYVADFTYERPTEPDCNGEVHWIKVVEDTKGVRTDKYKIKKKLMQDRFGIVIQEV